MTRRWNGLQNPFITDDAKTLFDFPSLHFAEVDTIEIPDSTHLVDAFDWLEEMKLTHRERGEPWTTESDWKMTYHDEHYRFSFVNPQRAMMFRLAFGGKVIAGTKATIA